MLTFSFLYPNIGSQTGGQGDADWKAKPEVARLVDSDMAKRKKAWDDGQALRSQAVGTKQRAMKRGC